MSVQKYQEKVTISKVKKAYTTLSQVYRQIFNEYGYAGEWDDPSSSINKTAELFQPYFNTIKTCKNYSDKTACAQLNKLYSLSGELIKDDVAPSDNKTAFVVLNDGTIILFAGGQSAYIILENQKNLILNKNIFNITFKNDGSTGSLKCSNSLDPVNLYNGDIGNGCPPTAVDWIILYNNMDYIHCAQKLHNTGKHSCK